ncbi:aldehyde ferredoxin oxidoreductase family protein [Candidatus Aerophobetes bacterium]|nr:aldehyde ferredoxin oxidoreductase family protein [Candidatus Aerophobetes bacterium]
MGDGYWRKLLRIDLSTNLVKEESISEDLCKKLLGGVGFGAEILLKEVGPEVHPFDPENRLIFGLGPFQATQIPGSGKWIAVSKSPLTNILCFSVAGGRMGSMLKRAGYDGLIIQGRASKPVYIWIDNDRVEIKDASFLWGKDTVETVDIIRDKLNEPKAAIACIGQAGERLVGIACIVVDKSSFAGRGGLGAVMGSKNLKAVAVKGTKNVEVFDSGKVMSLTREINQKIRTTAPEEFLKGGTTCEVIPTEEFGDLPLRYWAGDTGGIWKEGAKKIGDPYYTQALKVDIKECAKWSCDNCPIRCHRFIHLEEPPEYAVTGIGPQYEALAMLGSCNLVDDLAAISRANDLCNRYGVDCISAGAFVGFATECYERGLLTKKETGGQELKWGDGELLINLVKQIGEREGLGKLFANGIVRAAEAIGGEAKEIAVHVKGMDFPAHDPRAFFSLAVSYATGARGACHTHGLCFKAAQGALLPEMGITEPPDRFEMERKEYIAAKFHDLSALHDSLTMCNFMLFGGMGITDMLNCVNAITGWDWKLEDFLTTAERITTLKRVVNVRYGISRKDDKLPKRVFQPAKEGSRAGKIPIPFEVALDGYYSLRGWDSDGKPTVETLVKYGLTEALKPIWK